MFNVCNKKFNIKNIELIHPRKQEEVFNIARILNGICDYIIIFGSSIRWDCNQTSDLDVAITKDSNVKDKKALYSLLAKETNDNFDLLDIQDIDKDLNELQKENVLKKGVKIYA